MSESERNGEELKGGQGGGDHSHSSHSFKIKIDRQEFTVMQNVLTGAELRRLPDPDIGMDRDLFEVVPGGSDRKIELEERVQMRDGLRFFTAPAQINPGRR
jgi:hypothetical protein